MWFYTVRHIAHAGYYVSFFMFIISYKYFSPSKACLIIIVPQKIFFPIFSPLSSQMGTENRTVHLYQPYFALFLCFSSIFGLKQPLVAFFISSGITCEAFAFAFPTVPNAFALYLLFAYSSGKSLQICINSPVSSMMYFKPTYFF